jgi:hypothetical protein
LAIALIVAAGLAAPAAAERLCRDLKGLFTPCPEALTKVAQERLQERINAVPTVEAPAAAKPRAVASAKPAPKPHKKLCHDIRGLYTPCT